MENTGFWIKNEAGQVQFKGGKNDWSEAAEIAGSCPHFLEDYEGEIVAEEARSCYNCRFRRWTAASFVCLKSKKSSVTRD